MRKYLILMIIVVLVTVSGLLLLGRKGTNEQIMKNSGHEMFETTKAMLSGRWISIDDEKSVIEFTDGTKVDYYDKNRVSEGFYHISDISSSSAIGKGEFILVRDGEDFLEYSIKKLTKNNLELIFLPRGNILKYKK